VREGRHRVPRLVVAREIVPASEPRYWRLDLMATFASFAGVASTVDREGEHDHFDSYEMSSVCWQRQV